MIFKEALEFIEPQELFELLPSGSRILLESTLCNTQNRWALIGYAPSSIFESKMGTHTLDGKRLCGNPFSLLSELLTKTSPPKEFPFQGGWIGCVSYESARYLDLPTQKSEDFDLLFYKIESFYLFDLWDRKLYCASSEGKIQELESYIEQASKNSCLPKSQRPVCRSFRELSANQSRQKYLSSLERIHQHIRDGESYQVNLSQKFSMDCSVNPFEIYKALARRSPVPYAGFFEKEKTVIISGSPERLFEVQGKKIRTRPIAGTRRIGTHESETQKFFQELRKDPKEHAEHSMLVDLSRNDLGQVCRYGSVKVSSYMDIVPYRTVIHTESEVEGELLEKVGFYEIMKALFPGGTITGVPKKSTMKIIRDLESGPRSFYTGAMGYWSSCGHADFNIMIRPVLYKNGQAHTHAGGGITFKSDAKREYKETLHKARSQILSMIEAHI